MAERDNVKISSIFGTYITLLGYSWGMSDIWRFPFMAYRNGGGAFLIPFAITILICGMPLFYIEFGMGKFSGKGLYRVWDIAPLFRGAGLATSIAYSIYIFGMTVFRGWLFQFTFYAFKDPLPWSTCSNSWNTPTCREAGSLYSPNYTKISEYSNITTNNAHNVSLDTSTTISNLSNSKVGLTSAEEFWQYNILELSTGLADVYPLQLRYIVFTFVWRAVVMTVALFGIQGVEKVMYVTATVPILTSIVMLVRSLMLPGALDGLYHFFYPDLDRLLDVKIWIEAFVMGFYTLGFGWGCIVYLGSRTRFRDNISTVAILLPILGAAMAIFQGLVCFSVLGNMAASFGVDVKDVIEANLSTGIVAYVTALSTLPLPQLWSLMFFISSTLSGLDTQIVPFQMVLQMLGEIFPILGSKYRVHTAVGLSIILFVLGLPTCTGAGAYMFMVLDWYIGAWSGPIVAFVEVLVIGWMYGLDRWSEDVKLMSGRATSVFMHIGIGFTTPVVVLVIIFVSIVNYIPPVYGSYTFPVWVRLLGWMSLAAVISPILIIAIVHIYQENGTLWQKLKLSVKPSNEWGPADSDSGSQNSNLKHTYKARGFNDLVSYNFTRRRRPQSKTQATSQEMTDLV